MVHVWSSKGMNAGKTGKKDMVIQDNNIANSVLRLKSSSRISDDDRLYTEKLEDSDGICDSFY
jgi:hypothetical protein